MSKGVARGASYMLATFYHEILVSLWIEEKVKWIYNDERVLQIANNVHILTGNDCVLVRIINFAKGFTTGRKKTWCDNTSTPCHQWVFYFNKWSDIYIYLQIESCSTVYETNRVLYWSYVVMETFLLVNALIFDVMRWIIKVMCFIRIY